MPHRSEIPANVPASVTRPGRPANAIQDRAGFDKMTKRLDDKQLRRHCIDVLRIERQSPFRLPGNQGGVRRALVKGLIEVKKRSQKCEPGPALCKIGSTLGDCLQSADVSAQLVRRVRLRTRAQIEVVVSRINRCRRETGERLVESVRDVFGYLVLNRKNIFKATIVAI